MTRSPSTDAGAEAVTEVLAEGLDLPLWSHPGWSGRFPWLLQGTTGRGSSADDTFDYGLFGQTPVGRAMERWRSLRDATRVEAVVHSRQVHGTRLHTWNAPPAQGIVIIDGFDAHSCDHPGVLLTVSTADCIPVFLVVEDPRTIVLVHAGWRGVAAGAVEVAIEHLLVSTGVEPGELWLHCGPAICGECYEVGPEVHAAVNPNGPRRDRPEPIDLRQAVVHRATEAGLDPARSTVSTWCTRCARGEFFSHRAGASGRQIGLLGIRQDG